MLGSRMITFFLVNLFFLFDGGMDLVGEMREWDDLDIIGIGDAVEKQLDRDIGNGAEIVDLDGGDGEDKVDLGDCDGGDIVNLDVDDEA